jgi:hypothetical protein
MCALISAYKNRFPQSLWQNMVSVEFHLWQKDAIQEEYAYLNKTSMQIIKDAWYKKLVFHCEQLS